MPESTIVSDLAPKYSNPEILTERITTRDGCFEDIPELVEVDLRSFSRVYDGYGKSDEELKSDLLAKFRHRFDLVGPRWTKVAERDGEIVGFMMSCPTNQDPYSFQSWEDSTGNGTLDGTYDPHGKNLYIVSLSMLPAGSSELAQNMLFGRLLADFVKDDFDVAYFESRLPGLKVWVKKQCRINGLDFESLTKQDLDVFATEYFSLKKEKDGKLVPYDRLLQVYDSAGCEFVGVYPDAYQDEPSLNYGVLGIFKNPMPELLRKSKIVRGFASIAIRQASKSNRLMNRYF